MTRWSLLAALVLVLLVLIIACWKESPNYPNDPPEV